jgi:predicted nucleic acid-binding protein
MADRDDETLFISSMTVAEIHRGILEKPTGRKRTDLERCFPDRKARRRSSPAVYSLSMKRQA